MVKRHTIAVLDEGPDDAGDVPSWFRHLAFEEFERVWLGTVLDHVDQLVDIRHGTERPSLAQLAEMLTSIRDRYRLARKRRLETRVERRGGSRKKSIQRR